jgi:hypothetical protein
MRSTALTLALMTFASISAASTTDQQALYDAFARQALDGMWGKVVGPDGKVLNPKNEKDRTTIPVSGEMVERVVLSGRIVGHAIWCEMQWKEDYLWFMQAERKRNKFSTTQAAYVGFLFGMSQNAFANDLKAGKPCQAADREEIQRALNTLGGAYRRHGKL